MKLPRESTACLRITWRTATVPQDNIRGGANKLALAEVRPKQKSLSLRSFGRWASFEWITV